MSTDRTLKLATACLLLAGAVWSDVSEDRGRLRSAHLLSETAGWTLTDGALLMTGDAGAHWIDISPHGGTLVSAFFLDASSGWVLLGRELNGPDVTGFGPGEEFDLASTADGGAAWTIQHVDLPDPGPKGLSSEGWVFFADPLHGWVMVRINGNTAFNGGVLAATDDGGRHWQHREAPTAGPISFSTPLVGWLADENFDDGIYATIDGGNHWREVMLPPPPGVPPDPSMQYRLPHWMDATHAYVDVFFEHERMPKPILALYATADGGYTWALTGALPRGDLAADKTAMVGPAWIDTSIEKGVLTIETIVPGTTLVTVPTTSVSADLNAMFGLAPVEGVNFIDMRHGWVLAYGKLFSTVDGGVNWTDITPDQAKGMRRNVVRGKAAPQSTK